MGKFILKRILSLIPTVFISMAIIFFLMQALPVDPIHLMYDTEDMTDAQIQELEEELQEAIRESRYEKAAQLRDQLQRGTWT